MCIHLLKEKELELSTPNLVHIFISMAGSQNAMTLRSKGQGYRVMKHAAGVGMHVDMTS